MPESADDLQIRRARDADLPEMARIHFQSYPGVEMTLQERLNHLKEHPLATLEDHWVCTRNSRLVGIYTLFKFHTIRASKLIPTGGIGGVAVAPEARRGRVANYMMAQAIETMDRNDTPLSLLYPFQHRFYRKLGWGLLSRMTVFRFVPEALPLYEERHSVSPVQTAEDREKVSLCYKHFAAANNGLLERSDAQWSERVLKTATCFAYTSADTGEVEGYLTYSYIPHPQEQHFVTTDLRVWELVYLNDRALRGILGFLSAQREQVRAIDLPDQAGLQIEHILNNPQSPGGRHNWWLGSETGVVGAGLMGRVVQLRRALVAGGFGAGEGRVVFKIRDEFQPRNTEPLTVEFAGGNAKILPKQGADVELACDIATFSSLYWGALKLRDALRFGMAELSGRGDPLFLHQVFDLPAPICFDHF